MREAGIDISRQKSKEIDKNLLLKMDIVITLCGHAEATCPLTPPHIKRLHWPIEDPVGTRGTEEVIMKDFRRARDEIRDRITTFIREIVRSEGL
jgi:arsenate reductase